MKKVLYSLPLKIFAAIVCTISIMMAAASGFAMLLSGEVDKEEVLHSAKENLFSNKAACILDNYEESGKAGIVGMNLELDMDYSLYTYAENEEEATCIWNSGYPVSTEEFDYKYSGEEGGYYSYDTRNMFRAMINPAYSYDHNVYETEDFVITDIIYAPNLGLFLYETSQGYFVSEMISIDGMEYTIATLDKYVYVDSEQNILETSQYADWGTVVLDYVGAYEMRNGFFTIKDVEEEMVVYASSYEVKGDVISVGKEMAEIKHVVIYGKEKNLDLATKDSWYTAAEQVIETIWDFVEISVGIEVVSVLLTLISFVYLMVVAGHRSGDDEIHLRIWDKVPFFVFSMLLGCAAFGFCAFGALIIMDGIEVMSLSAVVALTTECLVTGLLICIWYCMSVVTRFKAKAFWKYTEFGYLLRPFKNVYGQIRENIGLFWKTILILAILSVVELFVILATGYEPDVEVLFFFLYKVVEVLVVVLAVLQLSKLQEGSKRIVDGDLETPIDTSHMFWDFKKHGENINKMTEGISKAVEEQMKSERFKTELITNVSHDIKTPLTSIINYVDLIKKEDVQDETLQEYIEVLDRQSARLKKLIEDLMEASKASTGNLAVNFEKFEVGVMLTQTVGEFQEKLSASGIELVVNTPEEEIYILADARHLWRVFDNLINNICKYAQPGTRAFVDVTKVNGYAIVTFKNTSKEMLNMSSEALLERFVRGDSSRNTEGSGLGLSIAQSLTELMNGRLKLDIDGDLFKVSIMFPIVYHKVS